uniref:Uncharacterized protein n=1 Tax=viral metagenome TaxID=1070528 RepID=A0A6C0JFI2_9ZZZZ
MDINSIVDILFVINAFFIGTKNMNHVHAQFAAKIYFLIHGKFT